MSKTIQVHAATCNFRTKCDAQTAANLALPDGKVEINFVNLFVKKCCADIHKLCFNKNFKFFSDFLRMNELLIKISSAVMISSWYHHQTNRQRRYRGCLAHRRLLVLYKQGAFRHLDHLGYNVKVDKELTHAIN